MGTGAGRITEEWEDVFHLTVGGGRGSRMSTRARKYGVYRADPADWMTVEALGLMGEPEIPDLPRSSRIVVNQ